MFRSINAFINETGAELLKSLRAPEFILPTLAMPVAFYLLFAVAMGTGNTGAGEMMLATFGVFAVMGPAIFGFGAGVATERERGWLQLKRAAPAPAFNFILAKILSTMIFAGFSLILLYVAARYAAGVELPRDTWARLMGLHLVASIPFAFLGLTLGFLFSANGAVAIANILFLALAALGGLWLPVFLFPDVLQRVATFLPSYHLGQIALDIVAADKADFDPAHIIPSLIATGLFAVTAVFAWAAQRS